MKFTFKAIIANQAASVLLRRAKGNISFRKLNQLLYLAARTSLKEIGFPITGDTFVNTSDGPALYRGCEYARTDMDDDELSKYSITTLEKLCDLYSDYDDSKMTELLRFVHCHSGRRTLLF